MTDKEAMQIAYGMLWLMKVDKSTKDGMDAMLKSKAREALRERLTQEERRDGIAAAMKLVEGDA